MSRRANGEGSVHRLQNGRWRAQLTIGFDQKTGKQLRRYKTANTQRQARQELENLRQRHAHMPLSAAPQTLEVFAQAWFRTKISQVRPRTLESYEGVLKRHVLPSLGRVKLQDVKAYEIQQLLDNVAEHVGRRTANYARTVLKSMLNQAVKWDLIVKNPVDGTSATADHPRAPTIWSGAEARCFLSVAEQHRLYALFYLLLATGLRRGEVLGLTWADVRDDAIVVARSVSTRTGVVIESRPKSHAGQRVVWIDEITRGVLREHAQRQRCELVGFGLRDDEIPERVFTNERGRTLDESNLSKTWHRLQDLAGVPRATLHDLRHMHLSRLVERGLDVRTVADRAGHADAVLTMRQYVHAFDAQRKKAAIPLDELLGDD